MKVTKIDILSLESQAAKKRPVTQKSGTNKAFIYSLTTKKEKRWQILAWGSAHLPKDYQKHVVPRQLPVSAHTSPNDRVSWACLYKTRSRDPGRCLLPSRRGDRMANVVTWHCPLEKVILELLVEGASLGDLPAGIGCLIPHNKRRYPFRNPRQGFDFQIVNRPWI